MGLGPQHALHAEVGHEPVDGAVRDGQSLTAQVGDHLASPVQRLRVPDRGLQRVDHDRVGYPARGRRRRGSPGPVGPRGDLAALLRQDSADRLDRVALLPHLIDERAGLPLLSRDPVTGEGGGELEDFKPLRRQGHRPDGRSPPPCHGASFTDRDDLGYGPDQNCGHR